MTTIKRGHRNIDEVKEVQRLLNLSGAKLSGTGWFGKETESAVKAFQTKIGVKVTGQVDAGTMAALKALESPDYAEVKSGNPAYEQAKKYTGKKESDSSFNKHMSSFWKLVKLPNYKTITGASFAWCALFIVAMNSEVGQDYVASASAKRQAAEGVEVVWQTQGIPQGAVIHINHNAKNAKTYEEHEKACKSSSGNHVGFADGYCAPSDYFSSDVQLYKDSSGYTRAKALAKKGSVVAILGGNQGNMVKRSIYDAREICEVRWPKQRDFPAKVTQSINCSGKSSGDESTR